ncbi:ABC transporter substrate-binding protein [Uliginosibacterium flavum]|uniref:ABC transporter substrate-binding protein n=1 Tax=Uliginosibacterium flavum TaxID=1396831 RepID=A0ABV2TLY3_9RHOO
MNFLTRPGATRSLRSALALWTCIAAPAALAFTQAPALEKAQQAKTLAPVDQRLPEKPEVIAPVAKTGTYGGMLRVAMRANNDQNSITRVISGNGLVRWRMDFNGVLPNVAESWTLSPDGSEYTFKLRKGMRWSDGSPFTADDVLFAMNDLMFNKQFFSASPGQYVANDKPASVSKLDDFSVRFKFSGPNLGFLDQLATPLGQHPVMYSKAYCGQFHPKYNPKLDELLAKEKAKDWPTLMRIKCGDIEIPSRWGNPEKPTLDAWVVKEPYSGSATRVVLERNPYFWQVDTAGQQLPYLDRVQFQIISEAETIILAAINGQLDYQHRHIFGIQNRPVLTENAAKGKYKMMALPGTGANSVGLWLNQSTKNDKLRKLMRNKDFRIALSLATDRKEVNDIVYLGQGMPWQIGPLKQSKWYNEKLGSQFLNYELKQANELLDRVGLAKRDADGFRLYPEGGRVSIGAIVSIAQTNQMETLELLRKQWAKAGLELVLQSSERSLFYDRANTNEYDISVDIVPGGMDITMNPRAVVAVHPQESRMSLPWARWFLSNGKQGEEPPASMKKRMQLFEQWQTAASPAEADALFKQILDIAADEFEVIGVIRSPNDTAIRSARLQNVYEQMLISWTYPNPAPALPQQWFFTK